MAAVFLVYIEFTYLIKRKTGTQETVWQIKTQVKLQMERRIFQNRNQVKKRMFLLAWLF